MKKLSLVLLSAMMVPVAGWALQADVIAASREGAGIPLAGQLSLGILNGEANEHVYDYETVDGSRRQLSRLDWDLKGVAMGGGSGSARLRPSRFNEGTSRTLPADAGVHSALQPTSRCIETSPK